MAGEQRNGSVTTVRRPSKTVLSRSNVGTTATGRGTITASGGGAGNSTTESSSPKLCKASPKLYKGSPKSLKGSPKLYLVNNNNSPQSERYVRRLHNPHGSPIAGRYKFYKEIRNGDSPELSRNTTSNSSYS